MEEIGGRSIVVIGVAVVMLGAGALGAPFAAPGTTSGQAGVSVDGPDRPDGPRGPGGPHDGALTSTGGGGPSVGDTTVFAPIPAPGFPEGIAVVDGTVYVTGPASFPGVLLGVGGDAEPGGDASRIWTFDPETGTPGETILFDGVETAEHGLANLAADSQGRLYVNALEPGLGVLRVEPASADITPYAALPDIPPCGPTAPAPPDCSPTLLDRPPLPNDLAFHADGDLYVTDSSQATIWRVPPGGDAEPWFQHDAFDQLIAANGIRAGPDGETLYIAVTTSDFRPTWPAGIYTLPVTASPAPSDLALFAETGGIDGFAFGASGLLYAADSDDHQVVVLDADGTEVLRFPDPVENAQRDVPYDAPATLAFDDADRSILVTNHAIFDGAAFPDHFAVLKAFVDDTALPLATPDIP